MRRTAWTFLLGIAMLSVGASNAPAGQFKRAVYYKAGSLPYQVVAAQLTNSGNVDLVLADYLSNQLVVLLGNGDGTFQAAMKFSAPAPIGLAVADLNHDGKRDLLVVESGGTGNGALAVFLGHGDGTFSFKASYPVGSEAGFVTVADFNGDGNFDVAETDQGNGSEGVLRVFRGTGRGTLLKPTVYKIPDTPGALAAADLNGDQHPDLALVQYATGSVGVLINDGTGKFLKPVTYSAGGGEAVDVKIADLRSNGDQDLVVANTSQGLVVLLNNGDGTFGSAEDLSSLHWKSALRRPAGSRGRRLQSRRPSRRGGRHQHRRLLLLLRQGRRHLRPGQAPQEHHPTKGRLLDRRRRLQQRRRPRPRPPHPELRQGRNSAQHPLRRPRATPCCERRLVLLNGVAMQPRLQSQPRPAPATRN